MPNPPSSLAESEPDAAARAAGPLLLEAFTAVSDMPALADCAAHQLAGLAPGARLSLYWTDGSLSGDGLRLFAAPASAAQRLHDRRVVNLLLGHAAESKSRAREIDGAKLLLLPGPRPNVAAAVLLEGLAPETPLGKALLAALRWRSAELLDREYLSRSVQRLEQAEHLQRALYAIADLASAELEMSDMLRHIHEIVGELMYAENFYIALCDLDRGGLRFVYFADSVDQAAVSPEEVIPFADLDNSLTLAFIRHGRTLHGPSEQLRAELGVQKDLRQGPDAEDWLGVPLVQSGEPIGALVVQSYHRDVGYSEDDATLLGYVAQHILTALQRKRAQAELEHRVRERTLELTIEVAERKRQEQLQSAFHRIAELASTTETMAAFYAAAHQIVGELLDARNFFVALIEAGDTLEFPYAVDERDPLRRFERRRMTNGITEYVIRSGRPLCADRERLDQIYQTGEARSIGTRSVCWLGVPLRGESGLLGVMAVQSYTPEVLYSERDQEVLTFVSHHVALALERKRAQESLKQANAELEARVLARTEQLNAANQELREQILSRERIERQLKHETLHDALTGLPNRSLLLDRLQQALAHTRQQPGTLFAVLFLDLDRFKVINDSVGHLVGDELLKQVGQLVRGCLREQDLIARLGGDEFALLLERIDSPEDALVVARRVIAVLTEPVRVGGKELFTSTSIGIAYSDPRYTAAEQLLRDADVAMYRAKALGRQRYAIFDEGLHREALALLELEGDLRRATSREEFEPYFQAIHDLRNGDILGYEALMRWHHPERGLLLPGQFLPVAEENGSSELIDWQLFHQVMRLVPVVCRGGRYVTVNVSARHFRDPDMSEQFLALIETYRVDPQSVRIEITEGALLENPEQIRLALDHLLSRGVLTVLDDFGTGYSSLSYLHQFPMHSLKIDRSFVADLKPGQTGGNAAVVRAIIALARSLAVEVIAEGIESTEQRDVLLELGCARGQGFLFSEPRPIGAIAI